MNITAGILLVCFLLILVFARKAATAIGMRKAADMARRLSDERYRDLVDSLPLVVFETNENGEFTFVNRSARSILGIDDNDVAKGLKAAEILAPEDRERAEAELVRALGGETLGNAEYTVQKKDGSSTPIMIRCGRIQTDGTPAGLRGIAIDITEQKTAEAEKAKLEQQLQQAQKMETIGTLAGGIAHDFNNILAAIIGYADLARGDAPKDGDLHYHLDQIVRAGFRAKDLVKQILMFSRQTHQDQAPLRLSPLIKEAKQFLRATLPSTIDIQVRVLTQTDKILADPTQIHQVIMNLCTNAGAAMQGKGGILEILLTREDLISGGPLPDVPEGAYLKLRIRDTGSGILPENIGRIFDPFFTTKKRGEGTGMGLAVVHGIVKNHRGGIHVTSIPGEGTTFDVYLPVCEEDTEPNREIQEAPARGNERILFVDDEIILVNMLDSMFRRLGYDVTVTTSSPDALELVRNDPDRFDIVITDLTMPAMTGIELSERISRVRSDMPVILCTGFGDRIDREKLRASGIVDIIFKPPLLTEMAAAIRSALDGVRKEKDTPHNGERTDHR